MTEWYPLDCYDYYSTCGAKNWRKAHLDKKKVHKNSPGWGWICNSSQSACSRPETNVYFSNNMGFNKYLFDSNWYFFDNFPTHKFLSHPLKSIFLIRLIPKAAMYIFLCSGVFVRHIFSFLDEFSVPTGSNYFENIFCESAYLLKPPSLPVAPAAILEVLALLLVRTFIWRVAKVKVGGINLHLLRPATATADILDVKQPLHSLLKRKSTRWFEQISA